VSSVLTVGVCMADESLKAFVLYVHNMVTVFLSLMSRTEDIYFVFLGGGLFRLQNFGRPLPLSFCDLSSRHCTN
jgi:hypothetical protein